MFVKTLAEKLGDQGIRAFSIDPGGMYGPRHTVGKKIDLSLAIRSGLQRHFTLEFQEMVARLQCSGGKSSAPVLVNTVDVTKQDWSTLMVNLLKSPPGVQSPKAPRLLSRA